MLSAYNQAGEVLATEVSPEDGPFSCPACQETLILKQGRKVIAHFAHYPEATCTYTNEGESDEHRLAKLEMYQALLQAPGVTDVRVERYLQDVRPDVSFVLRGELVAVEIQVSQLSRDDIEWRTKAYARKDIAVLWTPLLLQEVCEERYAPKDWERYLHAMYYGQVYREEQAQRARQEAQHTHLLEEFTRRDVKIAELEAELGRYRSHLAGLRFTIQQQEHQG